jgi:hypothetical protein
MQPFCSSPMLLSEQVKKCKHFFLQINDIQVHQNVENLKQEHRDIRKLYGVWQSFRATESSGMNKT